MDIQEKPTLAEKQEFWTEQLPNFEATYWLPSHFEFVVFDMDQGNYVIKEGLGPDFEDDATEIWHRVNTGWTMWKKAINFSRKQAQAVPEWISTSERMPPVDETVLVCWDYAPDIEPEKEYTTIDENLDEYWPNCQDEPPTHWMPLPKVIKAQEQKVTEMKIAWGMGCPKCNHNEATIHSTAEQDSGYEFMDGDEVVCLKCGNKGEMDADGENSDILWNEDEAQEPTND